MPLLYTQLTGTFEDATGAPLSGTASFAPNTTVYAGGVPVLQASAPVVAQITGGQLKSPSGGTLQLLDQGSTGLTFEGQTGFFFYTVSITVGGIVLDPWSFFLAHSAAPVDLFSLANTGAVSSLYVQKSGDTMTGQLTAPDVAASGLTGATATSRYAGATASGAPASGTFAVGDFVVDQSGKIWVCTTGGTPGTWTFLIPASGATMAGWLAPKVVTLTDAATVTPNLAQGNDFRLALTSAVGATRAIANPTGLTDGQQVTLALTQPASGGPCTVTWGTAYDFGAGSAPTLTTTASKGDLLGFKVIGTTLWFLGAGPGGY